jgi:hypothetical protein
MLTDRKLRIAWKAYLCELGVMQALERPSQAEVSERVGGYFRLRFMEAVAALSGDSSALAEALSEMLALVMGEEEIVGWKPVELEGARSRITHPLGNAGEY